VGLVSDHECIFGFSYLPETSEVHNECVTLPMKAKHIKY